MNQFYEEETTDGQGQGKRLLGWAVDIVAVITLAVFVVMMFGTKITVSGKSMEPSMKDGDVVLLNKLWYNFTDPKRMDIVAFHAKDGETKTYVKRVVGLPGETVQIRGGVLYINGKECPLPESAGELSLPGLAENGVTLAENEYFVLGDYSDTSEDSRFANIGNVTSDQIEGKVWFRAEPFNRMGFIK